MKHLVMAIVFAAGCLVASADPTPTAPPPKKAPDPLANANIDFNGYLRLASQAAEHRATRRLTEAEFIEMAKKEGVIVLDARSKEKFDLLHIKGAINLSFPDIDIESLKKTLPDTNATILIYCNNNFENGGPATTLRITPGNPQLNALAGKLGGEKKLAERAVAAFPSKNPQASLNISTYIALYGYGYRNVYELGPQLDPRVSKLTFESNVK